MADASLNARQEKQTNPKPKENIFLNLKTLFPGYHVPFSLYPTMAHLYEYASKDYDWITMEWSGLSQDDEFEGQAVCGSWGCPGDCYICVACEEMHKRIFLPIYGPMNQDGQPLGFLLVTG
jgi:hypothetical protein